jgi:hypothetical protein
MSPDATSPSEQNEAEEHLQRMEQQLAKDDEKLEQLDEEIRKAERKSKSVIRDPQP